MITLNTSLGDIKIILDFEGAPKSAANFLRYALEGFYNGTIFHRVISGFMVQAGGFESGMVKKKTHSPILNEADKSSNNVRGSLAFARTSDPHSATSQFFINVVDNHFLDYTSKTPTGWGYCTFGKVEEESMFVVDKIRKVPTTSRVGHQDVPVDDVLINNVLVDSLIEEKAGLVEE